MNKLSDEELRKAFKIWLRNYLGKEDEKSLGPFLNEEIKKFVPHQQGWLNKARKNLFLSAEAVAEKLEVSRAAYSKYEECEEKGSITLATLAKAAEAMGCELIYAIRPNSRKYFSNIIWAKLLPMAILHPWIRKCDQRKRSEALAYVAKKFMNDPKFRREQGWSQRKRL